MLPSDDDDASLVSCRYGSYGELLMAGWLAGGGGCCCGISYSSSSSWSIAWEKGEGESGGRLHLLAGPASIQPTSEPAPYCTIQKQAHINN